MLEKLSTEPDNQSASLQGTPTAYSLLNTLEEARVVAGQIWLLHHNNAPAQTIYKHMQS